MINLNFLMLAIVNGLVLASMYAIAALGLTLQWGVLKVLNFSHGAFMTWGAYFVWLLLEVMTGGYLVALPAALVISFFLGLTLYLIVIRPLQGKKESETNTFIATLGVSIILENMVINLIPAGGWTKSIPPIVAGYTEILGATVNNQQVLIMLLGPLSLGFLMFILLKTRLGLSVRAVAQDTVGAVIVGIETRRVYGYTVAIGSALAGFAGVLLGAYYFLSPHMGTSPLVTALFVMVLGGMGSIKGTVYGAYIIGIVDAFARFFIGAFWAEPILFAIFVLILLFRPQGLFGAR